MTAQELNQTVENLKLLGKEKVIDSAFQLFIDNQVTKSEFELILSKLEYSVPNGFFDMPSDYIKQYHQHIERTVELTDKGPVIMERQIFNKAYFYELVEASKKNKKSTEALINYAAKLDNLAIYILTMQQVRLKNVNYAIMHPKWMEFAEANSIKTLYDFYMAVKRLKSTHPLKVEFTNQFVSYLKKDIGFNLDLSLPFVNFVFGVEFLLSYLSSKVANTIRVKFLVYEKSYLKDNDYNHTLENCRTLINKHRMDIPQGEVNKLSEYYLKNEAILDSFNDNGYRAIFYSILAEV